MINIATKNDKKVKTKDKLSISEQNMVTAVKKVKEYKLSCEANIVSILYLNYETIYNYDDLKLKDFTHNEWRVFYQIAYDIIIKEEKQSLDDITIGLYLEKHPKLKAQYIEYGGFETIEKAKTYVKEANMESYVNEFHKWNAVITLLKKGFPVQDKISEFVDMSAEQIYNEYEATLNHIFINTEGDVKSYSISEGLDELIEELDDGIAVGMPYHGMELLSKETGGQYLGSITLVGGISNVGKSAFARTVAIPSALEFGEKLIIMLNEDGRKKWQRELLVWTANNIFKEELQKYTVRDGKYPPEVKDLLYRSAEWIKEQDREGVIRLIPFQKYRTANACKVINKYSSMGVKYFILDTFKADAGQVSSENWLQMSQAMVDINDIVKPESKNVHILITFQLAKSSAKQRHYTQDNIGQAKNMIDPASTCIMIRNVLEDEYTGERNQLKPYRLEGKNGKTQIPVKLDKDKKYQILFIIKNREGEANRYQIVVEHDMSRNILKEIALVHCPIDY